MLKNAIWLLYLIPLLLNMNGEISAQDPYLWKNRVIILACKDTANDVFHAQMKILAADTAGIKERDLVIIHLEEAIKKNILNVDYASKPLPDTGFRFVLRGKDGGVKLDSEKAVTLEQLYAIIDAMPMRRREKQKPDH